MKIEIDNKQAIFQWCAKLNCTGRDLMDAMFVIDHSEKAIDDYLILNIKKRTPFLQNVINIS